MKLIRHLCLKFSIAHFLPLNPPFCWPKQSQQQQQNAPLHVIYIGPKKKKTSCYEFAGLTPVARFETQSHRFTDKTTTTKPTPNFKHGRNCQNVVTRKKVTEKQLRSLLYLQNTTCKIRGISRQIQNSTEMERSRVLNNMNILEQWSTSICQWKFCNANTTRKVLFTSGVPSYVRLPYCCRRIAIPRYLSCTALFFLSRKLVSRKE